MASVKGVYVTWSSDPPNLKIQDWNVTELKVIVLVIGLIDCSDGAID